MADFTSEHSADVKQKPNQQEQIDGLGSIVKQILREIEIEHNDSIEILKYKPYNTVYDGRENDTQFFKSLITLAQTSQNSLSPIPSGKQITPNQCEDIATEAQKHRDANRLCHYDLYTRRQIEECKIKKEFQTLKCLCGCNKIIGDQLDLSVDQEKLSFLGPGIMLYFFFLKTLIIMIGIGTVIYGIQTIVFYYSGTQAFLQICSNSAYCQYKVRGSLQNNKNVSMGLKTSIWLGFLMSFCWIVILRIAKYKAILLEQEIDRGITTPSDRAIKIQNLPYGSNDQEEIVEMILEKWKNLPYQRHKKKINLKIGSVQIVYNMSKIRNMIFQIKYQAIKLAENLKQQKNPGKIKNITQEQYIFKKTKLIQTIELLQDLKKKFYSESIYRRKLATTCCIIQFKTQEIRARFLKKFGKKHRTLVDYLKQTLKKNLFYNCISQSQEEFYFKGNILQIQRAPQPQDILWQNCQIQYSYYRVLLIYSVSLFIILISIGILIGLNFIQNQILNNTMETGNVIAVLNYVISFSLIIINKILEITLVVLVKYQYNHTVSEEVVSNTNKTIATQALNCILVPLITKTYFQNKFFGSDGTSGTAFDFALQNSLLYLALLFFDPVYLLKKLLLWIRCSRHYLIRYLSRSTTYSKELGHIQQVNDFYQNPDICLKESYTFATILVLHASFYCMLSPNVLFIGFLALIAIYYSKKYLFVKRYCYPKMLEKSVFDSILMYVSGAPLFFGIGSMASVLIAGTTNIQVLAPCIVTIIISTLNIFNPKGIFDRFTSFIILSLEKCFKRVKLRIGNISTITPSLNISENQILQNSSDFSYNIDYYHNNNIATLFGYKRLIKGWNINQNVRDQIKRFVQSFEIDEDKDPHDFPPGTSNRKQSTG